jgi:predicted transcriptional regulator
MKRGRRPLAPDQLRGAAVDAARWLAGQRDADMQQAAKRFGISHQAVSQAWHRLDLGELPRVKKRRAQGAACVVLAKEGKSAATIAAELGVPRTAVYKWCGEAGIELRDPKMPNADALAAGLEVVRAGGTIGEGASIAGVQYAAFHRHLKKSGVHPSREQRGKKLGRSEQAVVLIEQEGFSPGDAAMIVGVSPGSVRSYLKRHAS